MVARMKTIYCISGLGADERAFSRLKVDGYKFEYLPWLIPVANETMEAYAHRMKENIVDECPVLMGLSFGGMMCIEISKLVPVDKVILISSIKSSNELPSWMKAASILRLNKILPMRPYKIIEPIQNNFLGVNNAEEIEMVRNYRKNASPQYLDWSINEVLNWRNNWQPPKLFHIHGDADKIFPINKLVPTHVIKNGGHFMIMNKAEEVNAALKLILTA